MEPLLTYRSVEICYQGRRTVQDISFALHPGEILGIVGESGSGKSSLLRAALGILGQGGLVTRGDIWFCGTNLPDATENELRAIRGRQIGMIFQDTKASLCPIRTIGDQIHESLAAHERLSRAESDRRARAMLEQLGFPDSGRILNSYPFELSGGMNQRVGIGLAMLSEPAVLLADEPTSALDVVHQRRIVAQLRTVRETCGTAILLVTHNIGAVSALADTVLVLHEGRTVEYGPAAQVLSHPRAAYTKTLLDAVPQLRAGKDRGTR